MNSGGHCNTDGNYSDVGEYYYNNFTIKDINYNRMVIQV